MSAIKKTAKITLFLFSVFILLLVGGGAYLYLNLDALAKRFSEQAASDALGVPVSIGEMTISLSEKKIVVNNISVANPKGYKNKNALTVKNITIAGESFSKELLTFALVQVGGIVVNLEVNERGVNLGALKKYSEKTAQKASKESKGNSSSSAGSDIKVIIRKFSLTDAQVNPSITLLNGDLASVKAPDINIIGIGEKENGALSQEVIAQIMNIVLEEFNQTANSAGFLKGLSLDMLNDIGVSTGEVFNKNLKDSYSKEVDKFKKGFDGIKGMFE
ncbi:MAG: hypothetical protein KAJ40_00035 [Alphaproteobacteria bacterium]|nr:hypothetical protein [Alphaproteobacteria bacterium]